MTAPRRDGQPTEGDVYTTPLRVDTASYPSIPDTRPDIQLPMQAERLFGCVNCEWRGTSMCPFGYKKGKGHPIEKNSHANGICEDRRNYLKSMTPTEFTSKKPNYSVWLIGYQQTMAQLESNRDFQILQELRTKIEEFELDGSKEKAKQYRQLMALEQTYRERWHNLWADLHKATQAQVDREEKVNNLITVDTLNLTQINNILKMGEEEDKRIVESLKKSKDEVEVEQLDK